MSTTGKQPSQLPRNGRATRDSMRIGAIDIGTNSIHMVIAEAAVHGGITTLWRMKEMIGLGRQSFPGKTIPREAIDQSVATMMRFVQAAQQRQCERVIAVATSAVREASNGGDFIERIARQVKIDVRVISGREEARLIYLGVRNVEPLRGGPHLIVDIGGGSVEFIVANHQRAMLLESRKLGAARMTAMFVKSDPISEDEHAALVKHYNKDLSAIADQIRDLKPIAAIGTSGTLENLAAMCESPRESVGKSDRPPVIRREDLDEVIKQLLKSTSNKRSQMLGLDEGRRDQITAGAILVGEFFRKLKLRRMQISGSALREGILVDYLSRHLPDLAIREQIPEPRTRSVIALARRCAWHKSHSEQVARLCMRLFDDLRPLHNMGAPERELIEYGALLHDIGWHIGQSGHHKHSMYLIRNGDLKHFTPEEIEIIANIARYHRKSLPKIKHLPYQKLSPRGKRVVNVGAALLRIADGLDRSHASVVRDLKCHANAKDVKCSINARFDAQLEIWGATRKSKMFAKVFRQPMIFELAR